MSDSRSQLVAGAVLILLGAGFLALQLLEGLGDSVFLFLIGSAFIGGYLYRRQFGLLIPGGVLIGAGLASVGEGVLTDFGNFEAIGMGLGFLAIYVIALIYQGSSPWWPLIPAAVLILGGLSEGSDTLERLLANGWPLILIFVGLILLAGAFGLTGRKT